MNHSNPTDHLIPIALDYLYAGMQAPDEIYNFDRKLLLVKKGDVLDDPKIRRIKKFNKSMRNIFVSPSTYAVLIEHSSSDDRFSSQRLEKESGYADLQSGVKSFLSTAASIDFIEIEQVEELSESLFDSLPTENIANILQCISTPRPMDDDLERHCLNVSLLNGLMGKWLGYTDKDIETLIMAGLVHDIGKTRIPSEILNAPRKLTDEEFQIIKNHPVYSHSILKNNEKFCDDIVFAARYHHESYLGGGYPDNLCGDNIPIFARITAISDVFDAMVSKRSYKTSNGPFAILGQFSNGFFNNLDKRLLAIFIKNLPICYLGKSALFSDGTLGIIKHVMPNDIEYPIVDTDGLIRQTNELWTCEKIIMDK